MARTALFLCAGIALVAAALAADEFAGLNTPLSNAAFKPGSLVKIASNDKYGYYKKSSKSHGKGYGKSHGDGKHGTYEKDGYKMKDGYYNNDEYKSDYGYGKDYKDYGDYSVDNQKHWYPKVCLQFTPTEALTNAIIAALEGTPYTGEPINVPITCCNSSKSHYGEGYGEGHGYHGEGHNYGGEGYNGEYDGEYDAYAASSKYGHGSKYGSKYGHGDGYNGGYKKADYDSLVGYSTHEGEYKDGYGYKSDSYGYGGYGNGPAPAGECVINEINIVSGEHVKHLGKDCDKLNITIKGECTIDKASAKKCFPYGHPGHGESETFDFEGHLYAIAAGYSTNGEGDYYANYPYVLTAAAPKGAAKASIASTKPAYSSDEYYSSEDGYESYEPAYTPHDVNRGLAIVLWAKIEKPEHCEGDYNCHESKHTKHGMIEATFLILDSSCKTLDTQTQVSIVGVADCESSGPVPMAKAGQIKGKFSKSSHGSYKY